MTIDTDNLVDDFISNLKEIFENHMKSLGLNEVFTDDIILIPITPSLAISCLGFFPQRLTMGKRARFEYSFIGELWYYHEEVSTDLHRSVVMRNAYKISDFILKNATLNGWLSVKPALVRSCTYSPRLRSGVLMASAKITILAPYHTIVESS